MSAPGRPIKPAAAMVAGAYSTAVYENALVAMFEEALAAGECFLDVSARSLHTKVCGAVRNDRGLAVCCRLMRRMMIPGDNEVSTSFRPSGHAPVIRYILPR